MLVPMSVAEHTKSVAHVNCGSCALQDTKGLDNRWGHAILRLVDAEVLERALGLGTPVLVRRNLDLAKGIAFDAHLVGSHLYRCGMEISGDGGVVDCV